MVIQHSLPTIHSRLIPRPLTTFFFLLVRCSPRHTCCRTHEVFWSVHSCIVDREPAKTTAADRNSASPRTIKALRWVFLCVFSGSDISSSEWYKSSSNGTETLDTESMSAMLLSWAQELTKWPIAEVESEKRHYNADSGKVCQQTLPQPKKRCED